MNFQMPYSTFLTKSIFYICLGGQLLIIGVPIRLWIWGAMLRSQVDFFINKVLGCLSKNYKLTVILVRHTIFRGKSAVTLRNPVKSAMICPKKSKNALGLIVSLLIFCGTIKCWILITLLITQENLKDPWYLL